MRQGAIITIDDNKIRRYAGNRVDLGLQISYHQGGKRGMTTHYAVECLTGTPLSLMFQLPGQSKIDIVKGVCKRMVGTAARDGPPDLSNYIISMDRGYSSPKVFIYCHECKCEGVIATLPRSKQLPFTFGHSASNSQTQVAETGDTVSLFAKGSITAGGQGGLTIPVTCIAHVTARGKERSKVALLGTSHPRLAGCRYTTSSVSSARVTRSGPTPIGILSFEDNVSTTTQVAMQNKMTISSLANLVMLTCSQRDPIWFLLRRFRFTSSTAVTFLRVMGTTLSTMDCDDAGDWESIHELLWTNTGSSAIALDSQSESSQAQLQTPAESSQAQAQPTLQLPTPSQMTQWTPKWTEAEFLLLTVAQL